MTAAATRLARTADRAVIAVQTFWLTPAAPDFAVALRFALAALGLIQLAVRGPVLFGRGDGLELAGYLAGLLGVALGYRTRVFAALAWLGHGAVLGGARALDAGDPMMQLLLCYLVFSPAGARWSVDAWLGRVSPAPTAVARIALRALQLHLCLIHLDAGLGAGLGGLVVLELGFAAAIWLTATRRIALLAAIALQMALAVATRQWLSGLTMIAFHLVAFGHVMTQTWPSLCLPGLRPRGPSHDDTQQRYPEIRGVVLPCGGGDAAPGRWR